MTRVALDCRVVSSQIDGLGRYTIELARAITRHRDGLELTLIIPSSLPEEHPLREVAGLAAHTVASSEPAMEPRSLVSVLPMLRRLAIDVYHYPHFNLPLVARSPSVITVHDVTPLSSPDYFRHRRSAKRMFFRLATAHALSRAAAVIVPSMATQADLLRAFPWARGRTHVIHEGVDHGFHSLVAPAEVERVRRQYGLLGRFVLYVGVARPHKNLTRLLRAYAAVAPSVPHDIALAGQAVGDVETLRALATELGIADRVHWLGYIDQRELPTLYAAADAFVLCSLNEGFGLPVIEAMASGTPVVVSRVGAAAEVAGDCAELVDPLSVRDISDGLRRVCTDRTRADELRVLGRQRAAAFTWERAADETIAVYRAVAHGN